MNTLKSANATSVVTPPATTDDMGAEQSQHLSKPPSKQAVLKEQLTAEIQRRMEVLPDAPNDPEEVIQPYTESLQTLERMWEDVQQIIPPLCLANFEYRLTGQSIPDEVRKTAIADFHQQMVETTAFNIPRPESIIKADVLAWNTQELADLLRESIVANVTSLVDGCFEALSSLVYQGVAGLAIWTSPTTLQYSFVRQVLEQSSSGKRTKRKLFDSGRVERRRTVATGSTTHSFVLHEHHVFGATETTVEDSTAVIPIAVQKYLDSVPDWLLPIHRIIDGTIANKEVREKAYRTVPWEQTIAEEVRVYGQDPALVIGDVVLTGWDTGDIQRELDRRQKIEDANTAARQQRQARWLSPLFAFLTLSVSVLPLILFLQTTSRTQLWAAWAAIALVIPFGILQTQYRDQARGTKSRSVIRAVSLVSMLLASGFGIVGFRLRQWPGIAIAVLLLATGITLARFSRVRATGSDVSEGGSP